MQKRQIGARPFCIAGAAEEVLCCRNSGAGRMVSKLLAAWLLMAFCVAVHATGVSQAVRHLRRRATRLRRSWQWTRLFIDLAVWIVLLHFIEIAAWALFYVWQDVMPDVQTAMYFSAVTYTTTGYGDVVLTVPWRLFGAVEALTGILMCGWSTGFFFAVVARMLETDGKPRDARNDRIGERASS